MASMDIEVLLLKAGIDKGMSTNDDEWDATTLRSATENNHPDFAWFLHSPEAIVQI